MAETVEQPHLQPAAPPHPTRFALTYLGPSDRYRDIDGTIFRQHRARIVDAETVDRLTRRTWRIVYADSWHAEPYTGQSSGEIVQEDARPGAESYATVFGPIDHPQ